jgi:hypothetical protein
MTGEPARQRGRTVLKRTEWVLESLLFNSRWRRPTAGARIMVASCE